MYNQKILPFYMTYPLPLYYQEEDTATRDLEYLQQMYPAEAKKYQKMVAGILDIRRQEEKENPDKEIPKEKWEWASDLVQIILFYEVYKRRHNNHNGILKF